MKHLITTFILPVKHLRTTKDDGHKTDSLMQSLYCCKTVHSEIQISIVLLNILKRTTY